MKDLEWVDGPPAKGAEEIRRALKDNPEKWAIVSTGAKSSAGSFKKSDGFETATRKNETGATVTYARYVGPLDALAK